jgi:cytochrome c oxidase subunit III
MSTIPLQTSHQAQGWTLPSRGKVGMYSLIIAESAIFTIFVTAYIYNIGKSTFGPTPQQVLEVPIFYSVCLLSSSFFIWLAEHAIAKKKMGAFIFWWAITFILGAIFLVGTGIEWHKLIYQDGLTISTNLFGTTYYCLVGLHATHVVLGLIMLLFVLIFAITGHLTPKHTERVEVLALYWHFVDAIWVVVFTVVYLIGR